MKISIITVVLNNKSYIEDCINCVLNQSYKNVEYIVIDGGSTDGTVDIIRKYEKFISMWISEPDSGIYDAMNKGIRLTTGEVVGILNADDVYNNNLVLNKIAGVFVESSVDVCYSDLVYVDKYNLSKVIRYWKSHDYLDGLFGRGWAPPHPTFFVRRAVYEKYGVFDLNYKLAADFELMIRFLGRFNIASVYIPTVLVKMRTGGATNKSVINIIKQNIEICRAGKKNNVYISPFALTFNKSLNRITQFISKPIKEV